MKARAQNKRAAAHDLGLGRPHTCSARRPCSVLGSPDPCPLLHLSSSPCRPSSLPNPPVHAEGAQQLSGG